jgi:cytochrome c556
MNFRSLPVVLFFSFFLVTAAAAESKTESKGESKKFKAPLIHVIVSDQIREIMLKLNMLMNERGITPIEIMEQRVEYLRKLITTANELVVAAERMTDAIPGVRIEPQNQVTFEALAKQLQEQAVNIAFLAEQTDEEGLEPAYQRMSETCNACHTLFRF